MPASVPFSTSENRSKIGACGGFYGAGLGDVTRNTEFQYYLTNRELSQSLACSPATSCHVEVAANLLKHDDIHLLHQQSEKRGRRRETPDGVGARRSWLHCPGVIRGWRVGWR